MTFIRKPFSLVEEENKGRQKKFRRVLDVVLG